MELVRLRICNVLLHQPRGGGANKGLFTRTAPVCRQARVSLSAEAPGELQSNPGPPEHHETAGCLLMLADLFVEEKAAVFLCVPLGTHEDPDRETDGDAEEERPAVGR